MIGLQYCVPSLPCCGLACQGLPARAYTRQTRGRHARHARQIVCSYKNVRGHGKRMPSTTSQAPRDRKNPLQNVDFQFEMPPLPDLDDIKTDRVIRGGLVGTLVGTITSLVVPSFEASAVAAAAAAIMALVPSSDPKKAASSITEEKSPDVPGKVAATIASEVQEAVEGNKDEGSAVTVAASAIVAGSTVSLFAAKSLPLVLVASAVYVAAQAENIDIKGSTISSRDFLRSRKEGGVGIVFSLIALQAKYAIDAFSFLTSSQGNAAQQPVPVRVTELEAPLEGTLQQAKGRTGKGKGQGKVADLKGISSDPSSEKLPTGSADFKPQTGVLGGNGQSGTDSSSPLQNLKGGDKKVAAGDLTTGPAEKKEVKPILKPESPATQTPGSGTPLEKAKGGNKGVGAGDLTTAPTDFSKNKDGLLTKDSPATQTPDSGSPLQKVKGGKSDTKADDLISGKTEFKPQETAASLKPGSPATETPGAASPLQNLKGGDVSSPKRNLTTEPVQFPERSATTLSSGSQGTKAPGQSTPLEKLKGGVKEAGDLVKSGADAVLEGKSPVSPAASTSPLESLKDKAVSSTSGTASSSHGSQDGKRSQSSLQLKSSQGRGKALQLSGLSPSAAAAAKAGESLSSKAQEGSNLLRNAESSSGSKSIISEPYEIGKTALEQKLPDTTGGASGQQRRSAARPSEISKLATQGASSLSRPAQEVRRITGLEKPEDTQSTAALAFAPRADVAGTGNFSSTAAAPQKKQTLVDKVLVLAGTGLFGSLIGVIYFLVQGQTLGHPVPRALLTAVFCCVAAIVLLISLGKRNPKPNTALA